MSFSKLYILKINKFNIFNLPIIFNSRFNKTTIFIITSYNSKVLDNKISNLYNRIFFN